MIIWIDNDACPKGVRELIFRAGQRLNIKIKLVANSYMHLPQSDLFEMICVNSGFDAADNFIADSVSPNDLVITSDIPLAARVVKAGAFAISSRGHVYDRENIDEQLTLRNLRQELRSSGELIGGPPPMVKEDLGKFAAAFDKLLTKLSRLK